MFLIFLKDTILLVGLRLHECPNVPKILIPAAWNLCSVHLEQSFIPPYTEQYLYG